MRNLLWIGTLLVTAVGLALSAQNSLAVEPALGALTPWGVQRGAETEVVFSGARLGDAQEILFYSPGIAVAAIEPGAGWRGRPRVPLLALR